MSAPVTFQTLHSTEILLNLSPQKQLFSVSFRSHSVLKELCETLIATLIYRSVIFIKGPKFRALTSQILLCFAEGCFCLCPCCMCVSQSPIKSLLLTIWKKNKIKKKSSWSWTVLNFLNDLEETDEINLSCILVSSAQSSSYQQ